MGVTVHWIDRNSLSRRSLALACRRFAGRHTYDKIGELLEDIRQDFDISHDKIVATVTDNASNFVKAFKEFGLRSEIIDEGKWYKANHLLIPASVFSTVTPRRVISFLRIRWLKYKK
ncbi:hypothetical protein V5799_021346 [Amblyomma americanum]|uniref:Uncharacterized protein n=1 Tax=Amblyomma americanum TaxID=6943 RepID=A0AAQ4FQI6_AMBAM